jgi:hypothetical protein
MLPELSRRDGSWFCSAADIRNVPAAWGKLSAFSKGLFRLCLSSIVFNRYVRPRHDESCSNAMLLACVEVDPEICLHLYHRTSHRPFVNLGKDKNSTQALDMDQLQWWPKVN